MQKFNKVVSSAVVLGSVLIASVGSIASAQANSLPTAMEDKLVAVCQAIKDDKRVALHRAVRESGMTYRSLAKGLVCNGENMYTFAQQYGAHTASEIIARKTNLDENGLTAKQ